MAILAEDADAGVRDIALAHYRNLLCGLEDKPLDVELRLAALASGAPA
jgi:hypothetical protein